MFIRIRGGRWGKRSGEGGGGREGGWRGRCLWRSGVVGLARLPVEKRKKKLNFIFFTLPQSDANRAQFVSRPPPTTPPSHLHLTSPALYTLTPSLLPHPLTPPPSFPPLPAPTPFFSCCIYFWFPLLLALILWIIAVWSFSREQFRPQKKRKMKKKNTHTS